jgi:putative ABC transport system permease protein
VSGFGRDLRHGARALLRRPGFTATAIVTFAVGIGANAAAFSLLHTILLRPLPFAEDGHLLFIEGNSTAPELSEGGRGFPDIRDWPGIERVFSGVAPISADVGFTLAGDHAPERVRGAFVTANFTDVMGVEPILGRGFLPSEEGPGTARVMLISEGLWMRRFAGDPGIVGTAVGVSSGTRTVVGVMPGQFQFPEASQVWVPHGNERTALRALRHLTAVGRLRFDDVTGPEATAALNNAVGLLGGSNTEVALRTMPLRQWIFGDERETVLIFYAMVSLVLLVACVNVANLLLARNETRRLELAVRASLGAGRIRIIRELLAESLVLAAVGGLVGMSIAWWGRDLILAFLPEGIPPHFSFEVPGELIVLLAATVIVCGLLFGLAPAVTMSRSRFADVLRAGGHTHSRGRSRSRLWPSLVASEVALALMVLICAGLMVKSVVLQGAVDPGFEADDRVTMYLTPSLSDQRLRSLYGALPDAARSTPGVSDAAIAQWLPTGRDDHWWSVYPEETAASGTERVVSTRYTRIGPGYFSTLRIPLLGGRDFDRTDGPGAPRVLIVNEAFARHHWAGQDPVGRRVARGGPPSSESGWLEVIGVVRNTHNAGYGRPAEPQIFLPYAQYGAENFFLIARTTFGLPAATRALREQVSAMESDVPISQISTMREAIATANWHTRFSAWAFSLLALIALVLAATGVYGLVAFTVAHRSRELAVRIVVGADTGTLEGAVVRQSLAWTGPGILAGIVLSLWSMRLVASLLFGVTPGDPGIYFASAVLMIGAVALASYLPARSVVRIAPLRALHPD